MPAPLALTMTALLLVVSYSATDVELRANQIAAAPAATDLFAGREWGAVSDGAQLRLAPAVAAEERAARDGLLFLALQVRHSLTTPVVVTVPRLTYQFEYEVDGVWYGFEAIAPAAAVSSGTVLVRLDAPMSLALVVPLNSPSSALQLRAVTAQGLGGALELSPGPHTIRVRPQPGAFGTNVRTTAVSNAVTVNIGAIPGGAGTSTPPFVIGKGLQAVAGPQNGRTLVEQAFRQPPTTMLTAAPHLARAESPQIVGPFERHALLLPRRLGAPNPALPEEATDFGYLVNAGGRGAAMPIVRVGARGQTTLVNVEPGAVAEPLAQALAQVAILEPVRDGAYEARILHVTAWAGMPLRLVLWLRSRAGAPDLFYQPRNPDPRVTSLMAFERLYTAQEFFMAVRQLPVSPRHDDAWALTTAAACAKDVPGAGGGRLALDRGTAEISVKDDQKTIVWRVHFPEEPARLMSHPGANFTIDESTGACGRFYQN